jgi:hypothetical protein
LREAIKENQRERKEKAMNLDDLIKSATFINLVLVSALTLKKLIEDENSKK